MAEPEVARRYHGQRTLLMLAAERSASQALERLIAIGLTGMLKTSMAGRADGIFGSIAPLDTMRLLLNQRCKRQCSG